MKRLLLFLASVAVSSGATLSNLTFDHITFSSWQAHVTVSGAYDGIRTLSAVAPASCSVVEQTASGGGGTGTANVDVSGKTGNTTYNGRDMDYGRYRSGENRSSLGGRLCAAAESSTSEYRVSR
jgi:hypothetical protein